MLTIYRRHTRNCGHRNEGRKYRRCRCPIWVDGCLAGDEIRKAMGLRDWEEAQRRLREWEAENRVTATDDAQPITVEYATQEFEKEATPRNLKPRTIYKYKLLFRQLKGFAEAEGIRYLKELDTPVLRKFR